MAPKKDIEALLENEKEWRRTIYTKVDRIEDKMGGVVVWSYVFRVVFFGAILAFLGKVIGG